MDELIQIAATELGTAQKSGEKSNDQILSYAHEIGMDWVDEDQTPWCSIFMNWCAMQAGLEQSGKANARSWLNCGIKVESPEPGDAVIFWRGNEESWKGHVGIFTGFDRKGERIYCLGGNQGNQVSVTGYPVDRLLGFRRLKPEVQLTLPEGILQNGDTGDKVKQLQKALNQTGYECGTADGIFGPKTHSAIEQLQASSDETDVDGIYGPLTRHFMLNLLS